MNFGQSVEKNHKNQKEKTAYKNLFSFLRYLRSKFDFWMIQYYLIEFFSKIAIVMSLVHRADLILHIYNVRNVLEVLLNNQPL